QGSRLAVHRAALLSAQPGGPRRGHLDGARPGVPGDAVRAEPRTHHRYRQSVPGGAPGSERVRVVSYRPRAEEFSWTFGGVPPVMKVEPGDIVELWTEDAFGGHVRGPDDVVSKVIQWPFVNPQTGPFFIEGAERSDTLAVDFVSIEPSREWGASTTVPLFGALTATHATALLHDPLPELVWMWALDRSAGTCRFTARRGRFAVA